MTLTTVGISSTILKQLELIESDSESLSAIIRLRTAVVEAADGTPLDGAKVCEKFAPVDYGLDEEHKKNLTILAELLRLDPSALAAKLFLDGATGHQIVNQVKTVPNAKLSSRTRATFLEGDLGL